jgi:hypothetical protein
MKEPHATADDAKHEALVAGNGQAGAARALAEDALLLGGLGRRLVRGDAEEGAHCSMLMSDRVAQRVSLRNAWRRIFKKRAGTAGRGRPQFKFRVGSASVSEDQTTHSASVAACFAAPHEVANSRRRLCIRRLGIFIGGRRCAASLCRVVADRARRGRRRRCRRTRAEARMLARRGGSRVQPPRGNSNSSRPLIAKISTARRRE